MIPCVSTRSIQLSLPEVKSSVVNIEGFKVPSDVNKVTQLAYFLRETLHLGASALHQLVMQVCVPYAIATRSLYSPVQTVCTCRCLLSNICAN